MGERSLAKTREGGRGSQCSGSPDTDCTPPTPPNRQTPAGEEAQAGNPYPLLLSQTDRVRAVQCLYHASVLLQASDGNHAPMLLRAGGGKPRPDALASRRRKTTLQTCSRACSGKLRIHVCTHCCFIVLHTPPKAPRTLTATAGLPCAIRRPHQTTTPPPP